MVKTIRVDRPVPEDAISLYDEGTREALALVLESSYSGRGSELEVVILDGLFTTAEILEALNRVSAEHRLVLDTTFFKGLSRGEVAKVFGKSEPTMRRLLASSLNVLAEVLIAI